MDRMKRQNMRPDDEPPGQKASNKVLGKSRGQLLIAPKRKSAGPKQKQCSVVDVSGGKSLML